MPRSASLRRLLRRRHGRHRLADFGAPPVAAFALRFSSPEYFALMVLGLALVVLLSGPSLVKGLLALLSGLWLTSIGTDIFTAQARFIFGT